MWGYYTFGYLGRVLTSWWHEGFRHSPRTPGDRLRSPCGRWLYAPRTPSSWHPWSPPRCTWDTDKKHSYCQQAERKTEHRHHWHWPDRLPCCRTNSFYIHFPFSAATLNIRLAPLPPTDRTGKGIFKKLLYCWCENWFTAGKAMRTTEWQNASEN